MQGSNAMNGKIIDKSEEEIFAFEVSDEALEQAAGTNDKVANVTIAFCSGLDTCPA
jgi:hypothetical protein